MSTLTGVIKASTVLDTEASPAISDNWISSDCEVLVTTSTYPVNIKNSITGFDISSVRLTDKMQRSVFGNIRLSDVSVMLRERYVYSKYPLIRVQDWGVSVNSVNLHMFQKYTYSNFLGNVAINAGISVNDVSLKLDGKAIYVNSESDSITNFAINSLQLSEVL